MKFTPRPSQCSLQQTLLPVRRWTSSRASGEVNSTSGRRCIDTIGMTSPVAVFVRTHVVVVDSYRTFGMVEDIVRGTAQHGALDFTGPTTTQHDEGRFLVLGKVHQPLVRTVSGGRHERCPHLRKWKQAVTEKNIIYGDIRVMTSQITNNSTVCTTTYSCLHQRKTPALWYIKTPAMYSLVGTLRNRIMIITQPCLKALNI